LLSQKNGILEEYLNKKIEQLKYPFFEDQKKDITFLWFDLFLRVIMINYISPEREFNEHSKNLNRKVL